MADLRTVQGASRWVAVTPSDSADLAEVPRGIYLGASGDVKMTDQAGNTLVFTAMSAGIEHAVQPTRIWSTGTTATGIRALY